MPIPPGRWDSEAKPHHGKGGDEILIAIKSLKQGMVIRTRAPVLLKFGWFLNRFRCIDPALCLFESASANHPYPSMLFALDENTIKTATVIEGG